MNLANAQTQTILIVDDNPANLGVLSDALDQAGFEVWVAKSGKVALERVKYALPHLILLDVMMPEIDGFETCRQLKADLQTENIPVIFMTALSDTTNKVEGFQVGAVDYITKPFQQEEVMARVKLHLKLSYLTAKLEQKNALLEQKIVEVNQAYDDLRQLQIKLVQGEKLSTLGQMFAGISHEINNPVDFIYGNLIHANEYTQKMLKILHLYQKDYPNPTPRLQAELELIDIEFIDNDLLSLLKSMNFGARRIREIVKTMQIFSHVDEVKLAEVDIHECLDGTLTMLNHRLKAQPQHPVIEVVKEYNLFQLVECYAGQLNQVFMNIIANGIDALDEYNQQRSLEEMIQNPSQIKIRTMLTEANWVTIHIADNGPGMCEEVKAKLFHPFFTTKAMGKGTGLGLSISHQIIVEKHGGSIDCQSTPGKGTEFTIQIPVQQ